jgi:hypothetical protein
LTRWSIRWSGLARLLIDHDYDYEMVVRGDAVLSWLLRDVLDKLNHMRGPGERYSDVILRLTEER